MGLFDFNIFDANIFDADAPPAPTAFAVLAASELDDRAVFRVTISETVDTTANIEPLIVLYDVRGDVIRADVTELQIRPDEITFLVKPDPDRPRQNPRNRPQPGTFAPSLTDSIASTGDVLYIAISLGEAADICNAAVTIS